MKIGIDLEEGGINDRRGATMKIPTREEEVAARQHLINKRVHQAVQVGRGKKEKQKMLEKGVIGN